MKKFIIVASVSLSFFAVYATPTLSNQTDTQAQRTNEDSTSQGGGIKYEARFSTNNLNVAIVVPIGTSADVTPDNAKALNGFWAHGGNIWMATGQAGSRSNFKVGDQILGFEPVKGEIAGIAILGMKDGIGSVRQLYLIENDGKIYNLYSQHNMLFQAVDMHDFEVVKALLETHPKLINSTDENGYTPLIDAAGSGQNEIAELLLANKANVNAKGNHGETALHEAALTDRQDMAELLLAHKADINAKAVGGLTPLSYALARNHEEMAQFLREHGGAE